MSQQVTNENLLKRLRRIEEEHDLHILYACEGGSRAYGLHHDGSDFDVRFLFVRKGTADVSVEHYKSKDDVIWVKEGGDWDISGWDLRKALQLLRVCNPSLLEWLFSPVMYLEVGDTAGSMREIARQYFNSTLCKRHYFRWVKPPYKKFLKAKEKEQDVPLKMILIVSRLLFALRWLEQPDAGLVPLSFEVLSSAALQGVDSCIAESVITLAAKRRVSGLSKMPHDQSASCIYKFIRDEFDRFDTMDYSTASTNQAPYTTLDAILQGVLQD